MHKWKRSFHFVQNNSLKRRLGNESGMTLIELLASLALLSVVLALVGAVHIFGLKQYQTQSYSARQSNDFAYTMSVISKEVRKASSINLSEDGNELTLDGVKYSFKNREILKDNTQVLAEGVAYFKVTPDSATNSVTIVLKSMAKNNSQPKEYQTKIYLRR